MHERSQTKNAIYYRIDREKSTRDWGAGERITKAGQKELWYAESVLHIIIVVLLSLFQIQSVYCTPELGGDVHL